MDDRITAAIANNVALYESVFRAHRLRFQRKGQFWHAIDPAPAWYSDAIALVPYAHVDTVMAALAKRPIASIKDSFADLDLTPAGFCELFAAQWIYHPAPDHIALRTLTWRRAETPADMARYRNSMAPPTRLLTISWRIRLLPSTSANGESKSLPAC